MPGPTLAIREQCPLATEANDGLMSAEQVQQLDAATGAVITTNKPAVVDNNTTPADGSLSTIAEALASGANLIQLEASATPYDWPTGTFYPPVPVGSTAVPLVIIGEMSAPLVSGTESVGGDTGTLTDGTLAMTPGANRGKFAQILTGALAGKMECIVDNTGTAVSLQSPIGNIGIGDTWQIVEPAATVAFPDTAPISICEGTIGFSKVNLLDPVGDASLTFLRANVFLQTCTITGFIATGIAVVSSAFDTINNAFLWDSLGAASPFAAPSAPSFYSNLNFMFLPKFTVNTCKIVGDVHLSVSVQSSDFLTDLNLRVATIVTNLGGVLNLQSTDSTIVKPTIDGDAFGSAIIVDVGSTGFSSPAPDGEIAINNSTFSAVFINRGAYARFGNISGTSAAAGSSGFEMFNMGRLTHANSTVTGAGGDVLFDGSGTYKTYGALPFVDSVDLAQAT